MIGARAKCEDDEPEKHVLMRENGSDSHCERERGRERESVFDIKSASSEEREEKYLRCNNVTGLK